MPTLFRFLLMCAGIAGVIYGTMYALAVFVEPRARDITVRLPSERVNPPAERAPAQGTSSTAPAAP